MENKGLLEEIKKLVVLIEDYKKEVEDLSVQKEGFSAVKNHLKLAIEESKEAVDKLIENINKTISNLEELLKINQQISENIDEKFSNKIKTLVENSLQLLTEGITALEFQDIIAQRMKKTLTFLEDLEKKILKILLIVGIDEEEHKNKKEELKKKLDEIEWKKEVSQDDVDDILKEFGL